MDGLKQQLARFSEQRGKIKANISKLYDKIRGIRETKGRTPKTNKYIEDHLKIISAKESKNKDLKTKIGEIRDGMKIQYTINKEQREREQQKREQRKSSKPVLVKSSKKPKPMPKPNNETSKLSKGLDDLRSSKNMVAQPLSINDLLRNTTNKKPNFKKALLSSSQQQQQPQPQRQRQRQQQQQQQQQPQKESKFSEERKKYRREIWIMLNKEIFGSENGISDIPEDDIQFRLFKILHEGLSHIEDTQIDNAYNQLEKSKPNKPSTRELIKQILIDYLLNKYKLIIKSKDQCNNFIQLFTIKGIKDIISSDKLRQSWDKYKTTKYKHILEGTNFTYEKEDIIIGNLLKHITFIFLELSNNNNANNNISFEKDVLSELLKKIKKFMSHNSTIDDIKLLFDSSTTDDIKRIQELYETYDSHKRYIESTIDLLMKLIEKAYREFDYKFIDYFIYHLNEFFENNHSTRERQKRIKKIINDYNACISENNIEEENISDEIISKIYKTYGKYTGSYAYIKYLLLKFPDIYIRKKGFEDDNLTLITVKQLEKEQLNNKKEKEEKEERKYKFNTLEQLLNLQQILLTEENKSQITETNKKLIEASINEIINSIIKNIQIIITDKQLDYLLSYLNKLNKLLNAREILYSLTDKQIATLKNKFNNIFAKIMLKIDKNFNEFIENKNVHNFIELVGLLQDSIFSYETNQSIFDEEDIHSLKEKCEEKENELIAKLKQLFSNNSSSYYYGYYEVLYQKIKLGKQIRKIQENKKFMELLQELSKKSIEQEKEIQQNIKLLEETKITTENLDEIRTLLYKLTTTSNFEKYLKLNKSKIVFPRNASNFYNLLERLSDEYKLQDKFRDFKILFEQQFAQSNKSNNEIIFILIQSIFKSETEFEINGFKSLVFNYIKEQLDSYVDNIMSEARILDKLKYKLQLIHDSPVNNSNNENYTELLNFLKQQYENKYRESRKKYINGVFDKYKKDKNKQYTENLNINEVKFKSDDFTFLIYALLCKSLELKKGLQILCFKKKSDMKIASIYTNKIRSNIRIEYDNRNVSGGAPKSWAKMEQKRQKALQAQQEIKELRYKEKKKEQIQEQEQIQLQLQQQTNEFGSIEEKRFTEYDEDLYIDSECSDCNINLSNISYFFDFIKRYNSSDDFILSTEELLIFFYYSNYDIFVILPSLDLYSKFRRLIYDGIKGEITKNYKGITQNIQDDYDIKILLDIIFSVISEFNDKDEYLYNNFEVNQKNQINKNDILLKYLSLIDKRIELFEKIISKLTAKQERKPSNHNFAMITGLKNLKEQYSDKKKQINSLLKSQQSNGVLFEQKNQSTENKIKALFRGELAELKDILQENNENNNENNNEINNLKMHLKKVLSLKNNDNDSNFIIEQIQEMLMEEQKNSNKKEINSNKKENPYYQGHSNTRLKITIVGWFRLYSIDICLKVLVNEKLNYNKYGSIIKLLTKKKYEVINPKKRKQKLLLVLENKNKNNSFNKPSKITDTEYRAVMGYTRLHTPYNANKITNTNFLKELHSEYGSENKLLEKELNNNSIMRTLTRYSNEKNSNINEYIKNIKSTTKKEKNEYVSNKLKYENNTELIKKCNSLLSKINEVYEQLNISNIEIKRFEFESEFKRLFEFNNKFSEISDNVLLFEYKKYLLNFNSLTLEKLIELIDASNDKKEKNIYKLIGRKLLNINLEKLIRELKKYLKEIKSKLKLQQKNAINMGSYNLPTKTPSNKKNWKNSIRLSELQKPLLTKYNNLPRNQYLDEIRTLLHNQANESAEQSTNQSAKQANQSAKQAKQSANQANESAEQSANQSAKQANQSAKQAKQSAKQAKQSAKQSAKQLDRQLANKARQLANNAIQSAKQANESPKQSAKQANESPKQSANNATQSANQTKESNKKIIIDEIMALIPKFKRMCYDESSYFKNLDLAFTVFKSNNDYTLFFEKTIAELNDTLSVIRTKIDELKTSKEIKENLIKPDQETIKTKDDNITRLKEKIRTKISLSKTETDKIKKQIDDLEKENKLIKDSIKKQKEKIKTLELNIENYIVKQKEIDKHISTFKEKIDIFKRIISVKSQTTATKKEMKPTQPSSVRIKKMLTINN